MAQSAETPTIPRLVTPRQLNSGTRMESDVVSPYHRILKINIVVSSAPYAYVPFRHRRIEKEYAGAYAQSARTLLLAIDVASARVGVVARGNDAYLPFPSPDGKWLATIQIK